MSERFARALRWVLAALGGVLIAAVTTPLTQASDDIAGVTIPWGFALALVTITAYVMGLRLASERRWPAILGGIGIVATTLYLSLPGPGGGVLLPGNLIGSLWAGVPPLIFVVVVAFPALRRR